MCPCPRRWALGCSALALLLAGCSQPGPDDGSTHDGPSLLDEIVPSLEPRPPTPSCSLSGTAADALPRLVAEGAPSSEASFPGAVALLPGLEQGLWIAESSGRVWSWVPGEPPEPIPKLIVDLSDRVDCCASRGLLAIARRPGPAPSEIFVHYHRADDPERTRVVRLSFDPAAGTADPDSESLVIELSHAGTAASGGALAFDADGMLLVGVGDDSIAAPSDPSSSPARDLGDLRGSVLRLDVSGPDPGYAIPPDNPHVAQPGARPEIFAHGLHDPRSCTASADDIWCTELGTGIRDELDLLAAADFGWPIVEGWRCTGPECEPSLYRGPRADYGLDDPESEPPHCGIVGGLALGPSGGGLHPGLAGAVLFADRCSGRTWGLRAELGAGAFEVIAAIESGALAMGRDAKGQPWLIDGLGRPTRLSVAQGGEPGTLATKLSQTGCFDELASLEPAPDLVPFVVASPLWSDGLLKARHIVVPPGESAVVHEAGHLRVPDRTLLIKTFVLEARPGDPTSRRPIETRFMVRRNGVWEFHSFRWTEAGDEAVRVSGEEQVQLELEGPEGPRELGWTFPDQVGCRNCHGFAGGRALGPVTAQLNRRVRYHDGEQIDERDQLAALAEIGLLAFEAGAPELSTLPALPDPRDPELPLDARARAYLHTNCSPCHQPRWLPPDLRFDTPLADTGMCDPILFPSPFVAGPRRVAPGEPEASNLWLRMATRGEGQMPPLGTSEVDPLGHALLEAWIEQLDDCP